MPRRLLIMDAELKGFHSPDVEDLEAYAPADPECFSFLLQLFIGPKSEAGEESFDVEVCTPKWIDERLDDEKVMIGRHLLIVREYDFPRMMNFIRAYVGGCSGTSWNEIAEKLGRLGHWEFEDYKA